MGMMYHTLYDTYMHCEWPYGSCRTHSLINRTSKCNKGDKNDDVQMFLVIPPQMMVSNNAEVLSLLPERGDGNTIV